MAAMADEGHRGARGVMRSLRTLSFQLSGAQLGITVTSLLVGFLVEPSLAPLVEPLVTAIGLPAGSTVGFSVAVALTVATGAQMVVGELMPKNLAIARPTGMALATATPLRIVNTMLKPLIVFLNASANATVRLLGIEPRDELSGVHSLEELQVLIRSSREGGALEEEEFSLLTRSITFGEKSAADALVPRVAVKALPKSESITGMAQLALETGHSRFPVYEEDIDHIIGIAHVKDSYAVPADRRHMTRVEEIMRDALFVPETKDLASLLLQMRRDRQPLTVVVDEYGGTSGIITLEDLLEEIVGEIEDEHDPRDRGTSQSREQPSGIHVVSALLHEPEVLEVTGFEMPEGDYDTLAGFLLSLFDRIPEQGDHISYESWEFKVVEMDGNRIDKVLVVAPPPEQTPKP